MTPKEIFGMLRPKGDYTKTDMSNYTELNAGRIRTALLKKTPDILIPIFSLIEDKDSSVGSEIEKRVSSLENRFYAHSLDDKFNESIEELILTSIDARLYGIGIAELYLDDNNDFAFRRVDKECIFYEDSKVMLSMNGKKFEAKEPKYIIFKQKPVLIKLLWIVYAKHFVLSHFLKFTEFLGVPPLVANSSGSDADTIEAIADAISSIKSASYAVLSKDDALKVLEGRGSQADFLKFVDYADAEIAKAINGQVLTSNVGSSGSRAQAQVHETQRLEILAKDIKFATRIVNNAFKIIGLDPKLAIFYEKDKDLLQRAQTLEILYGMGYDMKLEDMNKEFDLPLTRKITSANKRLMFNAKKRSNLPLDRFDAFLQNDSFIKILSANEIKIKKELEKIMVEAASFEQAFESLLQAFPNMPMDELEDVFTTVLFNADLAGLDEGDY